MLPSFLLIGSLLIGVFNAFVWRLPPRDLNLPWAPVALFVLFLKTLEFFIVPPSFRPSLLLSNVILITVYGMGCGMGIALETGVEWAWRRWKKGT